MKDIIDGEINKRDLRIVYWRRYWQASSVTLSCCQWGDKHLNNSVDGNTELFAKYSVDGDNELSLLDLLIN